MSLLLLLLLLLTNVVTHSSVESSPMSSVRASSPGRGSLLTTPAGSMPKSLIQRPD
ncbi:MAG: hypothetical protein ACI9CV_001965 [Ilumatobacter sp.]|jgi:hypothetical protein